MYVHRGNRSPGARPSSLLMKMHSKRHDLSRPSSHVAVSVAPSLLSSPVVTLQRRSSIREGCRIRAAHCECHRRTVAPLPFLDRSASVALWRTHPLDREHRGPTCIHLCRSRGSNSANRHSFSLFPLARWRIHMRISAIKDSICSCWKRIDTIQDELKS